MTFIKLVLKIPHNYIFIIRHFSYLVQCMYFYIISSCCRHLPFLPNSLFLRLALICMCMRMHTKNAKKRVYIVSYSLRLKIGTKTSSAGWDCLRHDLKRHGVMVRSWQSSALPYQEQSGQKPKRQCHPSHDQPTHTSCSLQHKSHTIQMLPLILFNSLDTGDFVILTAWAFIRRNYMTKIMQVWLIVLCCASNYGIYHSDTHEKSSVC